MTAGCDSGRSNTRANGPSSEARSRCSSTRSTPTRGANKRSPNARNLNPAGASANRRRTRTGSHNGCGRGSYSTSCRTRNTKEAGYWFRWTARTYGHESWTRGPRGSARTGGTDGGTRRGSCTTRPWSGLSATHARSTNSARRRGGSRAATSCDFLGAGFVYSGLLDEPVAIYWPLPRVPRPSRSAWHAGHHIRPHGTFPVHTPAYYASCCRGRCCHAPCCCVF